MGQPDILTQTPSRVPPALNTTSDMPVIDVKKPDSDAAAAAAKPDASEKPVSPEVQPGATDSQPAKPADAAPAADPKDEQAEEAAVIKKPWFIKKIDAANEKTRALEQKLQAEAAERARLQAELEARTKPIEVKPEDDPEPAKADFPDPDAYTEARARWAARDESRKEKARASQEFEQRRAEEAKQRTQKSIEDLHKAHNTRVEKAKAELPDFEKVALRDDVVVPIPAFVEIERSEMGPQIMYAIGKDPTLAKAITDAYGNPQSMVDHQDGLTRVIRKLVEIEMGIKAERSRTVTKASDPIEPLKSTGGTSNPKSPEDMTMAEYDAWLTPQLNAQRRPNTPTRRQK